MFHTLTQDLRYSFRSLFKSRAFAFVAIATLGLGIGANTAVFSVINTVLIQPLPYPDSDQLTLLWTNFGADLPQNWISGPEYLEMQEYNSQFEAIGIIVPFTINLTGGDVPLEVETAAVSSNMFEILRAQALRGRLLTATDEKPGAPPVVVLGHGFWKSRFGQDPSIIGKTIQADGVAFTVVGILPPDFSIYHPDAQFPAEVQLWLPLLPLYNSAFGVDDYARMSRGSHGFRGVARLKPGVSLAQAQSDMDAVAARMKEKSPQYYNFEGWGITVLSLHGDLVEDFKPALLVLMVAVGFVLLIACVNVANLMMARAAVREREIAIRVVLGAGNFRLLRQLLTESLVLGALGGATGLLLAFVILRVLPLVAPGNLPRGQEIAIEGDVLIFTLVASLLTSVLFGLAPAFHSLKQDLSGSLKEGGRGGTTGIQQSRLRIGLVISEVALAMVLLVGAGLMIKSFSGLLQSDPGYRTNSILTMRLSLPSAKYSSDEQISSFFNRLLTQASSLPGVKAAGAISQLPLSGRYSSGTTRVDQSETVPEDKRAVEVDRRRVSPGYFDTMGVRLVKGRFFSEQDGSGASPVAIVDTEFVKRFWSGEEPIGRHLSINRDQEGNMIWREVVGIVEHSKHYNLNSTGREQVYFPYHQLPVSSMYLAVRTATDPTALVSAIRSEVLQLDPDQPIADIRTMEQRVETSVAQPRFNLLLLSAFAILALLLAAVGIYGVMAYSVSQRNHEIGIRIALGAETGQVRRLILFQGLKFVLIALVVGGLAAVALTRLATGLLYNVSPTDPLTYALVGVLLLGVAALACYIPALRATRVDPARVLQQE